MEWMMVETKVPQEDHVKVEVKVRLLVVMMVYEKVAMRVVG